MREIMLVFEGNEINEKRAAVLIQEEAFRVLDQENMNVRNFVNITREAAPAAPVWSGGILQVPDFLKKRNVKQKTAGGK